MRNIILAALFALLGCAALSGQASAQGVTRICIQTIGGNGSNNCVDGWAKVSLPALTATVTAVKLGASQLGMLDCYNPNATAAYVQIFDAPVASVTLGTTPPSQSIGIAATASRNFTLSPGEEFLNAISIAATTTPTGSTAPATALTCNLAYD
jgi:hypothetical protein